MKMKLSTKTIILAGTLTIGLASLGSPESARAEDKPEADASVSILSQYIWRGFELSKDSLVIQPSLTVGYKGFAANLWGNLDTDQFGMTSDTFNWNETDFTLSYDGSYEKLGYSIGYIYYDLDGADDTQEFYGGLSYDILLNPSLTVYRDVDNYKGWYVTLSVSHSFPVKEDIALDLSATAGFLDIDDTDYSELHNGLLSASVTFPVNEYISITPELDFSFALSSKADDYLKASNPSGDSNFIYGGISASFAF